MCLKYKPLYQLNFNQSSHVNGVRLFIPTESACVWFLCSYTAVPCVQRQALCQRLPASPRLSADDQNPGHAIHRWQVYLMHTHICHLDLSSFPFSHPPTSIYSVTAWHVNTSIRVKKLLVLLDLWLPALHLMYMAGIDSMKASITPAWRAFSWVSWHPYMSFSVFMASGINVTASTNVVARNCFDINNMKRLSKVPAATTWCFVVRCDPIPASLCLQWKKNESEICCPSADQSSNEWK